MNKVRLALATLTLSGAGLVALVAHEGYTDTAVIPVPGDVPTLGFGTTRHESGAPVRMGDKTDPVRALIRAAADVSDKERQLRTCIGDVPMHQHEWDVIVGWAYNVGTGAACRSTLVRKLQAGDYTGACNELPRWVYVAGRKVRGLEVRREKERAQCLGLAP